MKELRAAAMDIAKGAGAILRDFYHGEFQVEHKAPVDLVTDADRASEAYMLERLSRAFPDHAVLAEESGAGRSAGPFLWLVDPLDGTTNFAHRLPIFSVLIAVQERLPDGSHQTVVAVTLDPLRDELFVAERGAGAWLNDHPLVVSQTPRLIDAVLATGFPVARLFEPEIENHAEFCRLNLVSQAVRRFGSAGLDLAYVAAGRFDGFWESRLKPWDQTGGALLVTEAGGRVTRLDGSVFDPQVGSICASNGHLHDAIVAAVASSRSHPPASREGLAVFLPGELATRVPGAT